MVLPVILQTINLNGFSEVLTEVCLHGKTVTIWTEEIPAIYGEWIAGEGADNLPLSSARR